MAIEDVVPWTYKTFNKDKYEDTITFKDCTLTKNIGEFELGHEFYKIILDLDDDTFVFYSKTREFRFKHEERITIL